MGHIACKRPHPVMFREYLNRPDATREDLLRAIEQAALDLDAIDRERAVLLDALEGDRARAIDPTVLVVDPAALLVGLYLGLKFGGLGRGDLPVDIEVEQFDEPTVLHWKSSPSLARRLSRARAIRLFTVPTEMPRMVAISS